MLARSSTSVEAHLSSIVESTKAIVFLGTPHRGSPDFAAAGDLARSILSRLGFETTPTMLHALGLKNSDLERAQESFSALWHKHDFHVKTFQEGLGLIGINLGVLGSKVVPDYSSSLGDQRENTETIQANHREMCRFTGKDDPGFRKVSGELQAICASIEKGRQSTLGAEGGAEMNLAFRGVNVWDFGQTLSVNSIDLRDTNTKGLSEAEETYLRSLWFPEIDKHRRSIKSPANNTCRWLFENKSYEDWSVGKNRAWSNGLLRLKGKPGAGKSVLMKEAYRRALRMRSLSGPSCVAAFFFNAKGSGIEHSKAGALRSLLYQLLVQDREYLSKHVRRRSLDTPERSVQELEATLRTFLLRESQKQTTFIFIDGVDECDDADIRGLSYFWREVTTKAHERFINLNVMLACRYFNATYLDRCPEILIDIHNRDDISAYVEERFKIGIADQEPQWPQLRDAILEKCCGVFLWAVLVVDGLIEKWELGDGLIALLHHLDSLPEELNALFKQLFCSLDWEMRGLTWRLFSWAALATRPLRLHEWHHVLAFIKKPAPISLKAWKCTPDFTERDGQLERKIRALSRGLLEVTRDATGDIPEVTDDYPSQYAEAGSFALDHGETRVVQLIHGSVRQFFLANLFPPVEGGSVVSLNNLSQEETMRREGFGHIAILEMCVDYIWIPELDALVAARRQASRRKPPGSSLSSSTLATGGPLDTELSRSQMDFDDFVTALEVTEGNENQVYGSRECIKVLRWLNGISPSNSSSIDSEFPSPRSRCASVATFSIKSQRLEAYLALLPYIVDEFFNHARLALKAGVDPTPILDRLGKEEAWARWLALTEDDAPVPGFAQYLKANGFAGIKLFGQDEAAGVVPIMFNTRKAQRSKRKSAPGLDHIKHCRTRSGCYSCRNRRIKVRRRPKQFALKTEA